MKKLKRKIKEIKTKGIKYGILSIFINSSVRAWNYCVSVDYTYMGNAADEEQEEIDRILEMEAPLWNFQ